MASGAAVTSVAGDPTGSPTAGDRDGATSTATAPATTSRTATPTAPPDCPEDGALDSVTWTEAEGGLSLAVTPSSALRVCAGPLLRWESDPPGWTEVVDRAGPDADSDAVRQQYACHLRFARAKEVWRLEPWRPLVDEAQLLVDRCNPSAP